MNKTDLEINAQRSKQNTGYGHIGGSSALLLDGERGDYDSGAPLKMNKASTNKTFQSGDRLHKKQSSVEMSNLSSTGRRKQQNLGLGAGHSSQKSRNEMSDPILSMNVMASNSKKVDML